LSLYFRPIELINIIETIVEKSSFTDLGNPDIIILNKDLEACFNAPCIYKPNLYFHCLSHVTLANAEKVNELRNFILSTEFYLDSPIDLIYEDPSSLFWIHPLFNTYILANEKIVYTWTELCTRFLKFVTTEPTDFIPLANDIYKLHPNSSLTSAIQFKHFHTSQIPLILKQITKFLGKSNTIFTLCKNLKFNHITTKESINFFIEEIVINNNSLTPYVSSVVYI